MDFFFVSLRRSRRLSVGACHVETDGPAEPAPLLPLALALARVCLDAPAVPFPASGPALRHQVLLQRQARGKAGEISAARETKAGGGSE